MVWLNTSGPMLQLGIRPGREACGDMGILAALAQQHHRQVTAERTPHPREHVEGGNSRRFAVKQHEVERLGA